METRPGIRERDPQLIPVLLSRLAVEGAPTPPPLPLKEAGNLYTIAQEVRWLDGSRFAVGRWDGSLTLYDVVNDVTAPLRIEYAEALPESGGIRMITRLRDGKYASSNGSGAMAVWDAAHPERVETLLRYDAGLGSATTGNTVDAKDGTRYLVAGHDGGQLTIWCVGDEQLQFVKTADIRSPKPANPWGLQTVYAVEPIADDCVLTAADNGDLCVVEVPSGALVSRLRYNDTAQRGLNDLAVRGNLAVAVNCAVGPADHNTWLFRIESNGSLTGLDKINLRRDPNAAQVFAFCVRIATDEHGLLFIVATEEGLLWVGRIDGTTLNPIGNTTVSSNFGAALACDGDGRLVVVGDHLHMYQVQ
jgi:hypothetical protein